MALNPVPAITYVVLWGAYVASVTGSEVIIDTIPACEGALDVVTGCDSTFSKILSLGVLGTVPGAPPEVNAFFAVLGLTSRASIIWSVAELLRGT